MAESESLLLILQRKYRKLTKDELKKFNEIKNVNKDFHGAIWSIHTDQLNRKLANNHFMCQKFKLCHSIFKNQQQLNDHLN